MTKKNVFLKQKGVSGKVKAKVKYNAAKKLIVLTPIDDLKGGKTYKVTVKRRQGRRRPQVGREAQASPARSR